MEPRCFNRIIRYSLLGIFLALALLIWDMSKLFHQPMLTQGAEPAIIVLDKTATANHLIKLLFEKKLIRSSKLLKLVMRLKGQTSQLKAGIYQVKPGESAQEFILRVIAGDVMVEKFSIIEGTTWNTVSAKLADAPYLRYDSSVWQGIRGNHSNPEGLLLAETYQYEAGVSAAKMLMKSHQDLLTCIQENWNTRAPHLPYNSPYELLIAASIIEKESAIPQEKYLISGVMVNRIKDGMPLQMDPTVVYALGERFKGKLFRNDLSIDSPYNTYKYLGLPPTPIAMVGKEAIQAAAHPKRSDYYFYVAKGDGTHAFSETYEQHRLAIQRYRNRGLA